MAKKHHNKKAIHISEVYDRLVVVYPVMQRLLNNAMEIRGIGEDAGKELLVSLGMWTYLSESRKDTYLARRVMITCLEAECIDGGAG